MSVRESRPRRSTTHKIAIAVIVALLVWRPGLPAMAAPTGAPTPTLEELVQALRAQQQDLAEQKRKLQEQAKKIAGQEQKLTAQAKLIEEQQRNLKKLSGQMRLASTPANQAAVRPAVYTSQNATPEITPVAPDSGTPPPQPPTTETLPQPPAGGAPPQPKPPTAIETAPAGTQQPETFEKPREQFLLEAGGILLPPGVLQIEPSVQYTHVSANQVSISGFTIFDAIVIGTIDVNKLDSDIIQGEVTARLGLPFRTQVDVAIPGIYRRDTETFGVGTSTATDSTIEGTGIGDITAGIEWQPFLGHGWIPDVVLRVLGVFPTGKSAFDVGTQQINIGGGTMETRLKQSPTGSGFYTVEPGFTALWKFDPVAIFAGGTFKHSFERTFGNAGTIQPGDTYEFVSGMNFAINDQVALNLAFDDQIVTSTTQNGVKVTGSAFNDGRAIIGASVGITPNITLLGSLEIGLTQQSPDFVAELRLPITISLF
jgi:hypothetical protein